MRFDYGFIAGILFCFLIKMINCANIIHFVPTLSYSHVAFNAKLADLLVNDGNNVTVMLIDVDPNVSSSSIEKADILRVNANMSNGILPKTLWNNPGPYEDASPLNPKIVIKLIRVASIFVQTCKNIMADKNLIKQISSMNFDVGIVEQYDMCGIGFLKLIKVKSIIWLSATANYRMQPETLGINYPLSYVPELFSPFSDQMTLIERIINTGIASITEFLHKKLSVAEENRIFKRILKLNYYNLFNEAQDSSCIMTNTQPFLDFPAPTSNNIVNIGGLSVPVKKISQLNNKWKKIADEKPFMIITFGSIAKIIDMPKNMKNSLFKSFDIISNYNFIVKYENLTSNIIKYSNNVYLAKWLPQIDLICHKNYNGIITHGGWSSVLESLYYSKPMILMPLFADHFKNAKVIENLNLGIIIDKMNIKEDTFTNAIQELVLNSKYMKKSQMFAEMLHYSGPSELRVLVSHKILKILKPSSKFFKNNFQLKSNNYSLFQDIVLQIIIILFFIIIFILS